VADDELAPLAVADRFCQAGLAGAAAALRAVLDDHTVLLLGFDDSPAFEVVVAQGLLDVDMLASLAAPDRHQRVPVIGRRDADGVEVLVFRRHFNPFILRMDMDFSRDAQGLLDRRLGIAAGILISAIEGRQSD